MISEVARTYNFIEIGNFQYDGAIDWSPFLNPVKEYDDRIFDSMSIFPIVQTIEFHINKMKGTLKNNATWIRFSKQQIIDCC